MKVNTNLGDARKAKYDEFYTQYVDIEREINAYLEYDPNAFRDKTVLLPCDDPEWSNFTKYFAQRFEALGVKKLISTSYAPNSKGVGLNLQPTLFELESSTFDESKTSTRGKIFEISKDLTGDRKIDIEDLQWRYLEGDGDFRSVEIRRLRDEADIIITNPPFSLFREFLAWILEAEKQFVILGNVNAVTSRDIFPLIQEGKVWLGVTRTGVGSMWFEVSEDAPEKTGQKYVDGKRFQTVGSSAWFTNLDHGRRHNPLQLMSKSDNEKYGPISIRERGYLEYDNYLAIDVPNVDAIPADYLGAMGVPITFLSKHNPEQFEILDANNFRKPHQREKTSGLIKDADGSVQGVNRYVRILIRNRGKHEN